MQGDAPFSCRIHASRDQHRLSRLEGGSFGGGPCSRRMPRSRRRRAGNAVGAGHVVGEGQSVGAGHAVGTGHTVGAGRAVVAVGAAQVMQVAIRPAAGAGLAMSQVHPTWGDIKHIEYVWTTSARIAQGPATFGVHLAKSRLGSTQMFRPSFGASSTDIRLHTGWVRPGLVRVRGSTEFVVGSGSSRVSSAWLFDQVRGRFGQLRWTLDRREEKPCRWRRRAAEALSMRGEIRKLRARAR